MRATFNSHVWKLSFVITAVIGAAVLTARRCHEEFKVSATYVGDVSVTGSVIGEHKAAERF